MKLLDANILLYAYNTGSPQHDPMRRWLEQAIAGPEPVALCWQVLLAFLRIATHPNAFRKPYTQAEITGLVDVLLSRVQFLHATDRHWPVLRELLVRAQVRGNLMMDAHLAALAIEHGAELCTTDRDFTRFPGLRWTNPLDLAGEQV